MSLSTTAKVLWDDFVYYRQYTANIQKRKAEGQFTRPLKRTDERLALLDEMITWCRARHMDPRLWLYNLFQSRKWYFPPKLRPGDLMSEKMVERYHQLRDTGFYRQRVDMYAKVQAELNGEGFDPNRDLAPGVEATKARLLKSGNPDACMDALESETLGYHPQSKHCQTCPLAEPCKAKLVALMPFDVIALREGQLDSQDAKAIARQAVMFGR